MKKTEIKKIVSTYCDVCNAELESSYSTIKHFNGDEADLCSDKKHDNEASCYEKYLDKYKLQVIDIEAKKILFGGDKDVTLSLKNFESLVDHDTYIKVFGLHKSETIEPSFIYLNSKANLYDTCDSCDNCNGVQCATVSINKKIVNIIN